MFPKSRPRWGFLFEAARDFLQAARYFSMLQNTPSGYSPLVKRNCREGAACECSRRRRKTQIRQTTGRIWNAASW
jgi:hypothetical protein